MTPAHRFRALSGIAAVFLLLFTAVATSGARADANAPRWTAGDYWTYVRTSDNRTTRYDVIGAETVVLSQSYATFHLRKSVTTVSGGISTTVTTEEWARDADLGVAKSVVNIIIATVTLTYDPPLAGASFPLSAGKAWTVQSSLRTVVGSIETTVTVTGDAAVLSEGPLTVPAGSYTALAVRHNGALNQLGGSYSVQYYTAATGNWVKRDTYNANDQRTSEEVLTDYKCQACFSPSLVIVVAAVLAAAAILGLLFLRRRRSSGSGTGPPR